MNFSDAFKNIDSYGRLFHFHYASKLRYKTYCGSFVTLIVFTFISFLSIYQFMDYIQKTNYIINYNEEPPTDNDINLTNSTIMFSLRDSHARLIDQNKAFKIDIKLITLSNISNKNFSQQSQLYLTSKRIEYEKCLINSNGEIPKLYYDDYFCIKPNQNITLSGQLGNIQEDNSYLQIDLIKCNSNNESCIDENLIENKMSNMYIYMNLLNSRIDHRNEKGRIPKFSSFMFDWRMNYEINLKQINYETDSGFILRNSYLEEFFVYDKHMMIGSNGNNKNIKNYDNNKSRLNRILIRSTDQVGAYHRRYAKIQDFIAGIVGLLKIMVFFSEYIVNFFTNRLYIVGLMDDIDFNIGNIDNFFCKYINIDKPIIPNSNIPNIVPPIKTKIASINLKDSSQSDTKKS